MSLPRFVLASASPARLRLLTSIDIHPVVIPSGLDETGVQESDPLKLVNALAFQKANAVCEMLSASLLASDPKTLVLGCDSVLSMDGAIYGKPINPKDAFNRWQQMRGRWGELYTGHGLVQLPAQGKPRGWIICCQVTRVQFANVSDRQIEAYIATGEPLNCAGGFALEGKGGALVEQIIGCYTNVIGLSLPLLRQMLGELGYNITDFW
ncbi:MAG: septum formation inhibitor Maf [Cyanobacteria bacterium WB6_1B_304]|jgi:septum formation protein|nr:septum formation inhibitor Maf [Cyanobacteria bacterium WB6_1B_304]